MLYLIDFTPRTPNFYGNALKKISEKKKKCNILLFSYLCLLGLLVPLDWGEKVLEEAVRNTRLFLKASWTIPLSICPK